MTNEEFKVLEMAEKLLAEIQHDPLLQMQERRAEVRRAIRDYFSCEERGSIIRQHREKDSPRRFCGELEPTEGVR